MSSLKYRPARIYRHSPLRPGIHPCIDFREEVAQAEVPAEFEITRGVAINPAARIALLRVAPRSREGSLPLPPPLALGRGAPPDHALEGRPVYTVGYPAKDLRHDPAAMDAVFNEIFEVKRLQPGELLEVLPEAYSFRHDCFTSAGNAGAPVIDLASGLVIGLHHSRRWGLDKEATALWMLADSALFQGADVIWRLW